MTRDHNYKDFATFSYLLLALPPFLVLTPFLTAEIKTLKRRASLAAQWLRICLPMQGTRVRALVREDPTCHGATKPVRCNY